MLEAVLAERSLLTAPDQQLPEWTPESSSTSFVKAVEELNASLGRKVLELARKGGLLVFSLNQIAEVCLMQRPSAWLRFLPLDDNVLVS